MENETSRRIKIRRDFKYMHKSIDQLSERDLNEGRRGVGVARENR